MEQLQQEAAHSADCINLHSTSALSNFDEFERLLSTKQLVILLDYDGTLTPIVNDPSKAILSEEVRETLRHLPKHFVTGIVTGRSLAKILNFVGVPGLFYGGSHGFDILAPHMETDSNEHQLEEGVVRASSVLNFEHEKVDSSIDLHVYSGKKTTDYLDDFGTRYQVAAEFLPKLEDIKLDVMKAIKDIPGAEVEDNIYSISVHYRNCPRSYVQTIRDIVVNTKALHSDIRYRNGKEVYELQPDVQWNKGFAVEWMLEMLGLSQSRVSDALTEEDQNAEVINEENFEIDGISLPSNSNSQPTEMNSNSDFERNLIDSSKIFTIFIGDDKSDEDAFKVFRGDFCKQPQQPGFGILVSDVPKPTNAVYSLRDPSEVHELLKRLVELGQSKGTKPMYFCQKRRQTVVMKHHDHRRALNTNQL